MTGDRKSGEVVNHGRYLPSIITVTSRRLYSDGTRIDILTNKGQDSTWAQLHSHEHQENRFDNVYNIHFATGIFGRNVNTPKLQLGIGNALQPS